MEKKKAKKRTVYYVVGSLALAAAAVVAIPKVIDYLSVKFYNPTSTQTTDDDDWGPEIIKRETVTPADEEDSNGEL